MRKMIFSSEKYTGEFSLTYDLEGTLKIIDFGTIELEPVQKKFIAETAPLYFDGLKDFMPKVKYFTAVESTVAYTFDDFWVMYNKKINKKRCIPLWQKLSVAKQTKAVTGVPKYDNYLKLQSWRTKADPENYLRNEMWENEWN